MKLVNIKVLLAGMPYWASVIAELRCLASETHSQKLAENNDGGMLEKVHNLLTLSTSCNTFVLVDRYFVFSRTRYS